MVKTVLSANINTIIKHATVLDILVVFFVLSNYLISGVYYVYKIMYYKGK